MTTPQGAQAVTPTATTPTPPTEEPLAPLQDGNVLWKVRSLRNWYRRRYILDMERRRIIYEGSNKMVACSKPQNTFSIELADISDVRNGWKTDRFNKLSKSLDKMKKKKPESTGSLEETKCFSIVYGRRKLRTLDLVAPNEAVAQNWVKGIQHIINLRTTRKRDENYEIWLKSCFRKADESETGSLTFDESLILLRQLNVEMDRRDAWKLFNEANTNKKKKFGKDVLDADEFVAFYKALLKRPELEELYSKYVDLSGFMGPKHLHDFLTIEQKMNFSVEDCVHMIQLNEPEGEMKQERVLSLEGFRKLILSEFHDIYNSEHQKLHQDMFQPLSHYYVASSHNTYLLEDQLVGESSQEGYIKALKRGCRCVEIDCWDGPEGEPIVYHGYTLTSRITLKDVLSDAIKLYAFETSKFPLIISLENHCSTEQQKVMAKQFTDILGDMLYPGPFPNNFEELPSPEFLKEKVLIKGKRFPPNSEKCDHCEEPEYDEEEENAEGHEHVLKKKPEKAANLAKELSDITALPAVKFQSFKHSAEKYEYYDMSSLSESHASHLLTSSPGEFIKHTSQRLVRIYPKGARTSSSNYNPIPMWNAGCQIVALNYQTPDKGMFYNFCRFKENGRCGYILKPAFMRNDRISSDEELEKMTHRPPLQVLVRIISGQHIPKPGQVLEGEVVDPYVLVKIRGHEIDKQKHRTGYVHNNGFNPIWNEEFTLSVRVPEIAFLYFKVRDYSSTGRDEVLGEFMMPLKSVEQGYRHVHLIERSGRALIPASIFVHIQIFETQQNGV